MYFYWYKYFTASNAADFNACYLLDLDLPIIYFLVVGDVLGKCIIHRNAT
jgi:hypothetical protein